MKKEKKEVVRKRNFMPIIVLVFGVILGGLFVGFGIYNNATSDYVGLQLRSEEEIKKDVDNKVNEIFSLRLDREEEYKKSASSEKYTELSRKITIAEGELSDFEAELFNVKNGTFDGLKNNAIKSSVPLILLGIVVMVLSVLFFIKNKSMISGNKILTMNEEK